MLLPCRNSSNTAQNDIPSELHGYEPPYHDF